MTKITRCAESKFRPKDYWWMTEMITKRKRSRIKLAHKTKMHRIEHVIRASHFKSFRYCSSREGKEEKIIHQNGHKEWLLLRTARMHFPFEAAEKPEEYSCIRTAIRAITSAKRRQEETEWNRSRRRRISAWLCRKGKDEWRSGWKFATYVLL